MAHQYITLKNFRNLVDQKVSFSPFINIVNGKNGSGKSSLLESLYYLSVGKSFRSAKLDTIVQHDTSAFTLFSLSSRRSSNSSSSSGRELSSNNEQQYRVGIERAKNTNALIKVNGDFIRSATQLANISPTLLVEPETFELLDGGPNNRRRYMDWGVFHVEHNFSRAWKHYTKSLKQRNTLLRRGRIDRTEIAPWDAQMIKSSKWIDEYRREYIVSLVPVINEILSILNQSMDVDISYYRGWDKKTDYATVLGNVFDRDCKSGYSHQGPHRADIRIKTGGRYADEVLSRGQKKILIFAMILAQGKILNDRLNRKSIYLIDDISAELDTEHRKNLCSYLEGLETQVILTVVDKASIFPYFSEGIEKRMFHVEHGKVSQVN